MDFRAVIFILVAVAALPGYAQENGTNLLPRTKRNPTKLRHSRRFAERMPTSSYYDDYPPATSSQSQENHKPIFTNCSMYQPSVPEELTHTTTVIQVTAADKDPPESGGKVTYTFVATPQESQKFNIDPETGVITTRHSFDRDEPNREKEVYLTVRATDNGRPQLDDVCTFKVIIEDINDNPPVFDKVDYQESVPQDLPPKREVMRISATDVDDGNNSIVMYSLEPRSADIYNKTYFQIDSKTGVITLDRVIDRDPGYKFKLRATATDHGDIPKSAVINLDIQVVESNKKAPVFMSIPASPIVLLENFTDFTENIATLTAMSNDEKAPVFELVTGRTEQTNKYSTFRLESDANTAHIRLARRMDYESIAEYTLTIRIQNKYNLASETSINIQLEDVNDNIPAFTEVVSGVVLENEPAGTPVMQVRAIDADSTTAHNQVTYELADNTENFAIDRYTGNITTKKMFDREEQDFYNVKVIATDNSPSALYKTGVPNEGQQVFRIEIADKNDHPPKFTEAVYIAEAIPENANTNARVTQVNAQDNDTASLVHYSIFYGNENDAFVIDETTGEIRVNKNLDYETRTNYTLKVKAFDGAYEDNCEVHIKIENVNDNPPVFVSYQKTITIMEEELFPGCIAQLEAYDPDIPDRSAPQHILYFVVKEEQRMWLNINKKGCLSLIKPLDRDPPNGTESWQVLIGAKDEDGGPTGVQQTTEITITLTDINDNAPYLEMPQPVIWTENEPPGDIVKLNAEDNDGPENGRPFTFNIAPSATTEIQTKFTISGSTLKSLVRFDREERKSYFVPIAITDSGNPSLTGTSTLHVVIGDVNDNPMKSGYSEIFVYNYKGEAPDTEIGRVYVEDPDDWDLPDKRFEWAGMASPYFYLDPKTGMITMSQGTIDQSYILNFTVFENTTRYFSAHSVTATVNVTVKEIPEEAVDKSGSVRLVGITAEEFIESDSNGVSKRTMFRKYLAKFLNITEENVDVFTVLHSPHNTNTSLLDVRFSAHGSPYYSPEKLNAAVSVHNAELEKELGVVILMVNIDECLVERQYCEGSCINFLNKSREPIAVYTNTTTFVGVKAVVDPFCNCEVLSRPVCYNGGTLVGNDKCECEPGFEGPHCEILSVGFSGNGWALYPPLESCADSHLSLELRSNKKDGLVFYLGPTKPNRLLNVQDFISLEVVDGYPVLLLDFGTGTVKLDPKQIRLDDGEQHRIDIIWSRTTIELQVDNCKLPSCLSLKLKAGDNEFLNVNGPLQVGGSFVDFNYLDNHMNWTHKPSRVGFSGCVKNFTFNNKLYNLGMPGYSKNADIGCNAGVAVAVSFGIDPSFIIAIIICLAILLILLLAVVVHRRKTDDLYKDTDDIRENIINYEDEGGGEGDMTAYDLNVLRLMYNDAIQDKPLPDHLNSRPDEVPDICGFLDGKKQSVDNDPETNPFDDVRHYAYEGDGNTTGSLSSLASGTDEGDLNFDYLSNFGPRFRKLADIYGKDSSDDDDDDDNYQTTASESWC
ncbi:DE-cadherin isoform X2 [Halyomorpha halys]|uniref:DE-cadherin isoform X2 n=1 Tax=Halyomorpha halys TaxID=286706 RepID=UPI0006D50046|nr:DE-cadherin isoform X1 [Halyomorpha halys]